MRSLQLCELPHSDCLSMAAVVFAYFSMEHCGSFWMSQGHSKGRLVMLQLSASGGNPKKVYTPAIVLLHTGMEDVRFSL